MGEDGSGGALHLLCLAANSGVPLFCRSSRGGAPTRQQVGLLSGEWGPPGRCSWEPVKGGGSVDIKAPTEDLEGAADGELVHTWVSKKRDEGVSPPPHLMSPDFSSAPVLRHRLPQWGPHVWAKPGRAAELGKDRGHHGGVEKFPWQVWDCSWRQQGWDQGNGGPLLADGPGGPRFSEWERQEAVTGLLGPKVVCPVSD